MSNQLLLSFQTTWIHQVMAEGNIVDKANEDDVGYSFLSYTCNEFHHHGQNLVIHLFSDWYTRNPFIKSTNND